MKTLFYMLLISCLIVINIYANDNNMQDIVLSKDGSLLRGLTTEERDTSIIVEFEDSLKEINRSEILEIRKIERPKNSNSRLFKIIAGFCVNDIIGYDYKDVQGYDFGLGFRIGYGISIMPRLNLESTYTISFHESDTTGAETINLNALDVNCKYVLFSMRRIGLYANLGCGLDLFTTEGINTGYFSYIPRFGVGSYIYLSENIDLDLGFNVHIVRFDVGEDHKPDASYLQLLLLLNVKL